MQTFKLGDQVAVLHDTQKGRVIEIKSNRIKIEDENGFIWEYAGNELALQASKSDYKIEKDLHLKDLPIERHKMRKALQEETEIRTDNNELDLHIEELRDYHTHLTNFEIVQIQMTACRSFLQESIAINRKRIILIHGKGEGVLKSQIHDYLERLSNESGIKLDYHDASFQRYGMGGATEVIIYA